MSHTHLKKTLPVFVAGDSIYDQQLFVATENGLAPTSLQIDSVQSFYPTRPAFEPVVLKQMIDKMGGDDLLTERGYLFYEVV